MRIGVLALAAVLALPAAAAAQDLGFAPEPHPNVLPLARFSITPYLGVRVPYGSGRMYVITEDGTQFLASEARGGGLGLGVAAEGRVIGRFSITAAGTYTAADRDQVVLRTLDQDEIGRIQMDGPEVFFTRLGLTYRIPDPIPDTRRFHPSASVTVGPAFMWTRWSPLEGLPTDITQTRRHTTLGISFDAAHAFGPPGLAFSLGLDNYMAFWNPAVTRPRDEALYTFLFDEPVAIAYARTYGNILMLRTGVSFRF